MARLLVTGSRDSADWELMVQTLWDASARFPSGAVLVHGACRGADRMAAHVWAELLGWPTEPHPADWDTHGRRAGMLRNNHMVRLGADLCLAFLLPQSRGTRQCAEAAERAGIEVIRIWEEENP